MSSESKADAHRILRGFSTLATLTGIYPAGHPLVGDKVRELYESVQPYLTVDECVRIDVFGGVVHLNGVPVDGPSDTQAMRIDSVHIQAGVQPEEIAATADVLRITGDGEREPVNQQLFQRGVQHISVGRLVPLDTRWRSPSGPIIRSTRWTRTTKSHCCWPSKRSSTCRKTGDSIFEPFTIWYGC